MKKLFVCLMMTVLLLPLWAGGQQGAEAAASERLDNLNPSGLPVVKEKVTISVMGREAHLSNEPTNWNALKVPQLFEEWTNIHVDWQIVPGNAIAEKKNLAFASSDMPDVFFPGILSQSDEMKYGGLGMLVALNDLIDEYAPNVKKLFELEPATKFAATTPSGNIYTLPASSTCWIGSSPVTINIHTGWLEKAGMDIPETTEEFEAALTYFRDNDMNGNGNKNDEIPFGVRAGHLYHFMSIFGVVDSQSHRMVVDDKVIFTAIAPEVRDAIVWLNDLYQKGLIDPEVFTQDNRQFIAKGRNPETLYGVFMDWHGENIVGTPLLYDPETLEYTVYHPLEPLQTHNGKRPMWPSQPRSVRARELSITSTNEMPEVTMRWFDVIYDPWYGMHFQTSLPGEQWIEEGFTDDGRPIWRITENPPTMSYGEWKHMYSPANSTAQGTCNSLAFVKRVWQPAARMKQNTMEFYGDYMPAQVYPNPGPFFSDADTEEMAILRADINGFITKNFASWIVEGGVEGEWDDYVKELEKMNYDRLVEIWQGGYDQFYGIK